MFEIQGKYATAKVFTDALEPSAEGQIRTMCDQPFAEGAKIRIMPDVHAGKELRVFLVVSFYRQKNKCSVCGKGGIKLINYISRAEIEELCDGLIAEYSEHTDKETTAVDIDDFVKNYLKY